MVGDIAGARSRGGSAAANNPVLGSDVVGRGSGTGAAMSGSGTAEIGRGGEATGGAGRETGSGTFTVFNGTNPIRRTGGTTRRFTRAAAGPCGVGTTIATADLTGRGNAGAALHRIINSTAPSTWSRALGRNVRRRGPSFKESKYTALNVTAGRM
jgi:hypothetical protein